MCNFKNKIVITLFIVFSVLILISVILGFCYTNKPIYNVTAEISSGWIWDKKEVYYTIYKHGECKKTNEYQKSNTAIYNLKDIENGSVHDYPKCAEEIITWIDDENLSADKLFVTNDNYLFTVENSSQSLYNVTLYKYFPDSSKVKKIAEFTESNISHVQVIR